LRTAKIDFLQVCYLLLPSASFCHPVFVGCHPVLVGCHPALSAKGGSASG